jgi:SAM-dependent methyltransferase
MDKTAQQGFLDFYSKNKIAPVRQNIQDYKQHTNLRENLLKLLGIVPSFIEGKSVIEFGPGTGQNSLYFSLLKPKSLEMVEGNPKSISSLKSIMAQNRIDEFTLHETRFQDFKSSRKFDVVWAENCIPHQTDPVKMLELISNHVKDNGILVFTCLSGISYLSEILRKAVYLNSPAVNIKSIEDKLNYLRPFLVPHLKNLPSMTRYHDDWIIDNVIHPFTGSRLFSFYDAVRAIGKNFEVYKMTPDFSTNWNWYKSLYKDDNSLNQLHTSNYFSNNINLIDKSQEPISQSISNGQKLESLGNEVWHAMQRLELQHAGALDQFITKVIDIQTYIADYFPETSQAISEAIDTVLTGDLSKTSNKFSMWWGRGNIHVSFIKKLELQ